MKSVKTLTLLTICVTSLALAAALHSQSPSPSDRVFLTERVPVKTHSALIGLSPGTALHVVSENGDTFRVTDGMLTFDVPKAKLTTDANLAARLAQDDAGAQYRAQMEAYRQPEAAKRAEQERQAADVGYFVPEGGGPVIPATPENLSHFGPPLYAAGPNAANIVQTQVDRELAAARQQELELQRAQAAKRIAANNGQNRNQTAAQQQALQRSYQEAQQEQQERNRQNHNSAVLDDVEKNMSTRWLFHQPALSPLEESSVLSSARQAAVNDFAAQQRLNHVEQQIANQRWQEHNRQMERDMNAWKNR
jgi:hypothetical protein